MRDAPDGRGNPWREWLIGAEDGSASEFALVYEL